MARETSKRAAKKTSSKSDAHCAHCGVAVKLNDGGKAYPGGVVEPHDQPTGTSLCPGTGYPPLTEG